MIPDKVYDVLKFAAQVALPALAVFYAAMAKVWGFPYATEVPATITALVMLLGAFLQLNTALWNKNQNGE